MTDEEKFEAVLQELRELMLDLGSLGVRVVLIGGQVLALESRRQGGTGVISVTTKTEVVVERGFSFEPDLLLDMDGTEFMAERLPEILRQRSYKRTRDFRWSKPLGQDFIHLDLFAPEGVDPSALPVPMTLLPDARLALRNPLEVEVRLGERLVRIALPNAVGFLAMKVRAKLEQRPDKTKDCFDIFAYVSLKGVPVILEALDQAGGEGRLLRARLIDLFRTPTAPGVKDVVAYASSLGPEEQALLAHAVVDLFSEF